MTMAPAALTRSHDQPVGGGNIVGEQGRAERGADAFGGCEILDRLGHAVQRTDGIAAGQGRIRRLGLGQQFISRAQGDDRGVFGIDALDMAEIGGHRLARRGAARSDQFRQLPRAQAAQFGRLCENGAASIGLGLVRRHADFQSYARRLGVALHPTIPGVGGVIWSHAHPFAAAQPGQPHRRGRSGRTPRLRGQGTGRERIGRRRDAHRDRARRGRAGADLGHRRRIGHAPRGDRTGRRAPRHLETAGRRSIAYQDSRFPRRGAAVDRRGGAAADYQPAEGRRQRLDARGRGRRQGQTGAGRPSIRHAGRSARPVLCHPGAPQIPRRPHAANWLPPRIRSNG